MLYQLSYVPLSRDLEGSRTPIPKKCVLSAPRIPVPPQGLNEKETPSRRTESLSMNLIYEIKSAYLPSSAFFSAQPSSEPRDASARISSSLATAAASHAAASAFRVAHHSLAATDSSLRSFASCSFMFISL